MKTLPYLLASVALLVTTLNVKADPVKPSAVACAQNSVTVLVTSLPSDNAISSGFSPLGIQVKHIDRSTNQVSVLIILPEGTCQRIVYAQIPGTDTSTNVPAVPTQPAATVQPSTPAPVVYTPSNNVVYASAPIYYDTSYAYPYYGYSPYVGFPLTLGINFGFHSWGGYGHYSGHGFRR